MRQRQVTIELLRVVAMMMVLALHANFIAIGKPSDSTIFSCQGITQTIAQSLCICAVNTFVMISGWFGITPRIQGFANFMWQVFYFVFLSYIVFYLFDNIPISSKDVMSCFGLFSGGGWFVSSYIGLHILSPALNTFARTSTEKELSAFLVAFFLFELVWGNTASVPFVVGGYSTFSFIGIYLLASLIKKSDIKVKPRASLVLFCLCCLFNALLYTLTVYFRLDVLTSMIFNYINPLVIASSALLLLTFANMPDIKNKFFRILILWLGPSCFAAYLLHVGTNLSRNAYTEMMRELYDIFPGPIGFVYAVCCIIAIFLSAVLLDQPRKMIWKYIISPAFQKLR